MDNLKKRLMKKALEAETSEEAQGWANALRTVCLASKDK